MNLRPLGPEGPNADPHGLAPGHLASYPFDNTGVEGGAGSHTVVPPPPDATPFGALVVHDAVGPLLTVREVADRLRVSRATVYRLVQAGALPVLRVSNSIRIPAEALARGALPEQLAMRAQADELEGLRVRLPVDEQEVRPKVALPVVGPLAGELVVMVGGRERPVLHQKRHDGPEQATRPLAVDSGADFLPVPAERLGPLNRPH